MVEVFIEEKFLVECGDSVVLSIFVGDDYVYIYRFGVVYSVVVKFMLFDFLLICFGYVNCCIFFESGVFCI